MKTKQEVIDEYLNRQKNGEFDLITFEQTGEPRIESHNDVSNIYRDGKLITELGFDTEYHEYKFDRKVGAYGPDGFSLHVVLRGKVIRFSKKIEE
jgi:hypothetical protein